MIEICVRPREAGPDVFSYLGIDVALHVILPGHNADVAMHPQEITLMSPA